MDNGLNDGAGGSREPGSTEAGRSGALIETCRYASLSSRPGGLRSPPSWFRCILLAAGWQVIPAGWLLWDSWDSPSTRTLVLRTAVFLVVPLLSAVVHRSWRVGVAALLLPVIAIGVMFTVFMLIMPTGKW